MGGCGERGKRRAQPRLYRFHCTDGHDLVVDRWGKRLATEIGVRRHAERVAAGLMLRGRQIDCYALRIDIYDATGRIVMRQVFTDMRVTHGVRQG